MTDNPPGWLDADVVEDLDWPGERRTATQHDCIRHAADLRREADATIDAVEHARSLRFDADALDILAELRRMGNTTVTLDDARVSLADERMAALVNRPALGSFLNTTAPQDVSSWTRVNLGPALRGETCRITPSILWRDDHNALLYAGRVNGIHGDSGDGKSWAASIAAAQQLEAGHHVIGIDFEDDENVAIERLRDVLGVKPATIADQFHYYRPVEPFDVDAYEAITTDISQYSVTLVVIDSLGEAFGVEGIDEDRDVQVAPWLRRIARGLADLGPAVVLIDHSTKAKDNPLFPSGSKRKRAAITGASYLLEATTPLTREKGGRLRLTCAKDRHGQWRRGEHVATIDFAIYPDGGTSVKIWQPMTNEKTAQGADERLRLVARAALRAAKKAARPLSQRELVSLMSVKASTDTKRAGIDYAVGVGAMLIENGPRGSVLHSYLTDLDDAEPTAPDCAPTAPQAKSRDRDDHRASAPRPIRGADAVAVAVARSEIGPDSEVQAQSRSQTDDYELPEVF